MSSSVFTIPIPMCTAGLLQKLHPS